MKIDYKIIIGITLLTLVILVGGVWLSSSQANKNKEKLSKPLIGEKIAEMKSPHIKLGESHESYNSNPPTSGPHTGNDVAGAGIKDDFVADELVVHSLEHGAVVLWYREDLSPSEVDRLKKVFVSATGKKIMLPRKNLDVPVALTSWNYLLKLESIDEKKIKEFIETNNDRAPEKAPI